MKCSNCGAEVVENARFCEECGMSLVIMASIVMPAPTVTAQQTTCKCPPGQGTLDEEGYCENCGVKVNTKTKSQVEEVAGKYLAMVSDVGRRHATNEDAGTVANSVDGHEILIVADGVSSSIDAMSASKTAVTALRDVLSKYQCTEDAAACMQRGIEEAHSAILSLPGNESIDGDGPETTIIAALNTAEQLIIGWVGDSRAYLIDDCSEELLTQDDSWVEEVVQAGQLTREQAEADRRAHYVTQVLGMKDAPISIHILQTKLPQGKSLLLCSDGLWNYFQVAGSLAGSFQQAREQGDVLTVCKQLVQQANEQGGHDNITVALLTP